MAIDKFQGPVAVDLSGIPGNQLCTGLRGKAAFAISGTAVVITNPLVTLASTVLVQLNGSDTTLTSVRVTPANGSFTVNGNAAATAATPFSFLINND